MMGWLILLVLIALTLGTLRLLGARRAMLQLSAAALMFGAAGYALQGRPGLEGSAAAESARVPVTPLTEARHAFFGSFSAEESWMRFSEALARSGETGDAAGILVNAVKRYPGSAHLWIGLGNALVDHSQGITPPAEFAYRRAAELSPGYPAAPFFHGLALARSGDPDQALAMWRKVLADAPANASWRPLVAGAIDALEQSRRSPTPAR